jgi:hypothetical protein
MWTDIKHWIVSSSVSRDNNNNVNVKAYFIIYLFNEIRENSISKSDSSKATLVSRMVSEIN